MILLIAGLDPTGKAGLLRDAQICQQLKKSFFIIPTAMTVQNDQKVLNISYLDTIFYQKSFSMVDFKKLKAVKIGMLGNEKVVRFVIDYLKQIKKKNPKVKIVWDPIIQSSSGYRLITQKGFELAVKKLLPLVDIITPNMPELFFLGEHIGVPIRKPIYLKGGHLPSRSEDYLINGKRVLILKSKRFTKKLQGTGCAFSTALACYLSEGLTLEKACKKAKGMMHGLFQRYISGNSFRHRRTGTPIERFEKCFEEKKFRGVAQPG